MLKFDSTSIYNRAVNKLNQDPNWKAITNNSVISSLVKSNAEIMAETARYSEYLFAESKFNTAKNNSSILAMANMLGYQPKRKISATGQLYVSADPKMHLVGKTIPFDVVKDLNDSNNTIGWIKNPYGDLSINPSSVIKDSNGVSYTIIGSGLLKNNSYFTTIDIIQGTLRSLYIDIDSIKNTFTVSKMNPYLYIPFKIDNCENASNISSRRYFKLYVMYSNDGIDVSRYKEYRIVDNLILSDSTDYDVEVYNDLYNQNLFYAKFNNDSTKGNVLDLSTNTSIAGIRIDYLESAGESGNMDNLYSNFTIEDSLKSDGSEFGSSLYAINSTFLTGGKDEESVSEIKENSTKFYISNYSVGTKESYEKTILNTSFSIKSIGEIKPTKVRVYGGNYFDKETEQNRPVTYVSFISSNLEDIVTSTISEKSYKDIEDALNYYLGRLKSPQDTLKFDPPEYVPISIGLNCSIYNDKSSESLQNISSNIRSFIIEKWGPNSEEIDFGRNFLPSNLTKEIMNNFDEVKSIDVEIEANKKLVWEQAERVPTGEGAVVIHTCRIPFNFSPVFMGNKTVKGFKDFSVGSKYLFRLDLMYKKPISLAGSELNKSIFIADTELRDSRSFYVVHDQDNIWKNISSLGLKYSELDNSYRIEEGNCYQIEMPLDVYTDSDFERLQNQVKNQEVTTQNSLVNPGCLDNYIIYFSGSYEDDSDTIGQGWVEFSFDAIYNILQAFAVYDTTIADKLERCPLSVLKCDVNDEECFKLFQEIVKKYLDIYISMRPIDANLKLLSSSLNKNVILKNNKSVIYVDSYDSNFSGNFSENLTNIKSGRFISVNCEYEE